MADDRLKGRRRLALLLDPEVIEALVARAGGPRKLSAFVTRLLTDAANETEVAGQQEQGDQMLKVSMLDASPVPGEPYPDPWEMRAILRDHEARLLKLEQRG